MADPVIEFDKVVRTYGKGHAEVHALAGVDLQVQPGEFVAVMGPSGSGKSTAMNILGCLDVPTAGAYVSKASTSAPHASAARAAAPLLPRLRFPGIQPAQSDVRARERRAATRLSRHAAAERHKRAREALATVGLTGWESHTPSELSGGQMQRVAIARAIVTEPSVLFADEPTGNLDTARSIEIMELLVRFNRERGLTVLMVTHESEMAAYASRTIRFRDGHVESDERMGGPH